jgi:hypothetical protein
MLSVVVLNVVILSVIVLNVVMLSVIVSWRLSGAVTLNLYTAIYNLVP